MRAHWEFTEDDDLASITQKIREDFWKAAAEDLNNGLVINSYGIPCSDRVGYGIEFNYYAKV